MCFCDACASCIGPRFRSQSNSPLLRLRLLLSFVVLHHSIARIHGTTQHVPSFITLGFCTRTKGETCRGGKRERAHARSGATRRAKILLALLHNMLAVPRITTGTRFASAPLHVSYTWNPSLSRLHASHVRTAHLQRITIRSAARVKKASSQKEAGTLMAHLQVHRHMLKRIPATHAQAHMKAHLHTAFTRISTRASASNMHTQAHALLHQLCLCSPSHVCLFSLQCVLVTLTLSWDSM